METIESERRANWQVWIPGLIAGLIIGFTESIFAISFPSLIFSGPLQEFLPRGIAMGLITGAVIIIFSTLVSSSGKMISSIQDNPVVLMSVTISGIVAAIGTGPDLFPTVIAFILITTLLTGLFLWLLGYFQLGGLVRYIPYPVIGGFLAGTGWLMLQGSFSVMADFSLTIENLPMLLQSDQASRWIPGVVFGLVVFFGLRRINHLMVLPGMIIGGMILYFGALLISGLSIDEAVERGFLLGRIAGQISWRPLPLQEAFQANWSAILGQIGSIGSILILTLINVLLNVSGIEMAIKEDSDLNRELRMSGLANFFSGMGGGIIGYHALTLTSLSHRLGAKGRLPGLIGGAFCFLVLLFGADIAAYLPMPLLGGLLFMLGLDFLSDWVFTGYRKFSRVDFGVVLLILFIIATIGFLEGVAVGLVVAVILFVLNYSRMNIFHNTTNGTEMRSKVERAAHHRHILAQEGEHIHILELHGFIFFGSANTILEQIRARVEDPQQAQLLFLILDFRRVHGLDSSAAISFYKVQSLAANNQFKVLLTHLNELDRQLLERGGLVAKDTDTVFFADLDRALEWCEDYLLEVNQVTRKHMPLTLRQQLADMGFDKTYSDQLKSYLERIEIQTGDYLIHQNEDASDIYFIERGQVSVMLELEEGKKVRLRSSAMGTIVGEVSFYLDTKRTASVIADMPTVAYRLARSAMMEMKNKNPELVLAFNEMMLGLMSERLAASNRELAALNR